ncbi:MAG: hypothetical protein WEE36_09980 [Acidimicrobiia bacterium]
MPDERLTPEQAELEESTSRWMLAGLILMGLFVFAFPLFRFYEPAQRADERTLRRRAPDGLPLHDAFAERQVPVHLDGVQLDP